MLSTRPLRALPHLFILRFKYFVSIIISLKLYRGLARSLLRSPRAEIQARLARLQGWTPRLALSQPRVLQRSEEPPGLNQLLQLRR